VLNINNDRCLILFATILANNFFSKNCAKVDPQMGNYLPIKVVLSDIDEQNNSSQSLVQKRTTRNEQLANIRNLNQNNKTDDDKIQIKPVEGTILEEALLENLCGEADEELDRGEEGPMTNAQKAELITKLSANPKTKKHFETNDTFESYVENTLGGDKRTNHNLSTDYSRALHIRNSQSIQQLTTFKSIKSQRSYVSQMSSTRSRCVSRNDLCDQLQAHRSNISNKSKSERLIANLQNRTSNMSRNTSTITPNDNRWSKLTTYSLPSNFVNNNFSPMGEIDRRKTSIVCQTNEATLKMADELLKKGKIKPPKESTEEDGCECFCLVCD